MIQDDEFEILITTPERIKALGFKPQKEILTNHLLPYADELDEESTRFLIQVKTNLAKAVMLREMKPACGVWSSRLMKYMRIHGLKFSKEDHIALIKLAYELVLIPDLEPCKIHKFATMFLMLTKKRQLISPDELTLPWRPLYELGQKIFDKSSTSIGMYHYLKPKVSGKQGAGILDLIRKFLSGDGLDDALVLFGLPGADDKQLPTSLEGSYLSMTKCARPYFELNATKEILEAFLPQTNPWSTETHVMCQMAMFLPVALHPQHADKGHLLWFDKLMTVWDTWYNAQCGISELMILFSGLAKRNPGAVNWSPYVPKMFVRFLHALNLPVSYKDMQITRAHSLDMKHVASWIVWSINPDGVVLKQLRSFWSGVESYLHSANSGRWSYKLRDLLRKLAREFLNRVRREREKRFTETWENQVPDAYKLRDEDITEFVVIVLEPTLQAVYSRSGSLDISMGLQNLATLRPAIVIPPLLERLRTSLTSLTEPHRVTAAMSAVAAVARPLLRGPDADYPEGPTHVVPLLMAVLPGLDPNDLKKTIVSLHFILIFSWMVPFIDCSGAHEYYDDLTEEELLTCESTAQMEDFVLVFLDRMFVIIESSIHEHIRLDTKESDLSRSKTDIVMETALSSAMAAVLIQSSPKIFREALRKFKTFATETTFEPNVSGSMVGVLLRVFARTNSEATLAAFLPHLCEELNEILSSDEILTEDNLPRALLYRLVLLRHVLECDGTALLKYIPNILPILDRALKLHNRQAHSRVCDVLSNILSSLSYIDMKEWRSSPKDYGTAPEKWLPIREWGSGCLLKDCNFEWHVPSAEEAECAQMLINRYLKPEISRMRQWLSGERDMCRERRLGSFQIMFAIMSCSQFYPPPPEEPVALLESKVPATSIPFTRGVNYEVTVDGENLRVVLTNLLLDVQARLIADKSDDTRGLEMLIAVWERVVVLKSSHGGPPLEARLRSYAALERALDGRGGPSTNRADPGERGSGPARLRMLAAEAARLHDDARYDLACEAGITPSVLKVLHAFAELAVNTYSSVRMLAQIRLYWMLSHYPYSYRALVPALATQLAQGGTGEEWHAKHKGILFMMLGPRTGPLVSKQDWEVVRTLWPAILKAPLSEKPSMVRLEQAFCDALHRQFPTVNTRLTISTSAVEAATKLLTEDQLREPHFLEQLGGAVEYEVALSNKTEGVYLELMNELVDIIETPNIQWRRLELAMQMLTFCPSLQTLYPVNTVRACLRALIHDDITVRRTALRLTHYMLKQRKHSVVKVAMDPYDIAGVAKPDKLIPGYRKDLEWAMWSEDYLPESDEEWDKPWLRNPIYGFYAWPEKLEVAAPSSQQIFSSDLQPEQMEAGERCIYEFFSDDENVNKLVAFLTVEEKKGKDKFNGVRFAMFKLLFSQFGDQIANKFMTHALNCVRATDAQEAQQRFAAEIAAAALRAPRYWPRQRALDMYSKATEIIEAGLGSVTVETLEDWGTCLATGVEKLDPRRGAFLLRDLLRLCAPQAGADAAPDNDTSFSVCARLYALQGALGSLKWRAAPLAAHLLQRLEDANFIQHPYQNVRETVGSLLMTIFDTEVTFPGGDRGGAPNLEEFIASVLPRLAVLYDEHGDIVIKTAASAAAAVQCSSGREDSAECTPPRPLRDLAPVTQVGQLVDVARLTPEGAHVEEHAPQPTETNESDTEGGVVASRVDKELGVRLESALRLTGDSATPAPRDHATALNLLTTVLRGTMGVIVRGVQNSAIPSYALVRAACCVAARGPPQPHDEMPRAAAGFLASLALALHDPAAFHCALRHLDELAGGRSWWARLACLDFAQPLLFYGLPLLCDQVDRAVHTEKFALKLMRDKRLEVRQTASKLLTGLMHCRALPNEDRTIKILMRSCRSKELVERHFGVLGLCAYLASRPYSLGSKLGDVLAELARHTSAPDPIPATIRSSLADFRRTHQDDWPKHREQLTEEELDLLADLTSPPSYCA